MEGWRIRNCECLHHGRWNMHSAGHSGVATGRLGGLCLSGGAHWVLSRYNIAILEIVRFDVYEETASVIDDCIHVHI